jgi:hypothetical protein
MAHFRYVKEVLRAQVNRVGEAWELIEREYLASKIDKNGAKYKERGLKKEWLDWMKVRHKSALKRLNDAVDDKIKLFDGQSNFITKVKRLDHGSIFRRKKETVDCGSEKDLSKLQKRIDLLKDAYQNQNKVEEELKLD